MLYFQQLLLWTTLFSSTGGLHKVRETAGWTGLVTLFLLSLVPAARHSLLHSTPGYVENYVRMGLAIGQCYGQDTCCRNMTAGGIHSTEDARLWPSHSQTIVCAYHVPLYSDQKTWYTRVVRMVAGTFVQHVGDLWHGKSRLCTKQRTGYYMLHAHWMGGAPKGARPRGY